MKKRIFILLLIVANLSLTNFAFSSRIKNGLKALEVKDYFKAKKLLSKGFKYNPSPASFGLAVVYSRSDNPFFNLDSAYRYILIADSTWSFSKERKKLKWKKYGWTKSGIDSLKQIVSSQFYSIASEKNTVADYSTFLKRNPWAKEYQGVLYSRDSLAFQETIELNTSKSYKNYLETYPKSAFFDLAEQNYSHSLFKELTGDGTLESYKKFVANYPNSPLRYEADSMIYSMVTAPNTIEAYKDLVKNYSTNSLIDKGWKEFFQVYLFDYSKEKMNEFLQLYPEANNQLEIENDILLYDSLLFPFVKNNLFGLMDSKGKSVLAPNYAFIGEINEGLVMFGEFGLLGAIDRSGQIIIPAEYDVISSISHGRFVVEKNELLGLIDRKGKVLLECELDDIGELENGRMYVSKNDIYSYTDYNGNQLIADTFINATNFRNNFAIVEKESGFGVIQESGESVLPFQLDYLKWINDTILSFSENGKWGMITLNNDTVLAPRYDYIGEFHEGISLVVKNDSVFYFNTQGKNFMKKYFQIFPNYRVKGEFNNSTAIIYENGKYGRINKKGDVITEVDYENLGSGTKIIPFEVNGFWGVMSLSNKILISPKYDGIEIVGNRFAIINYEDSLGVINVKGEVIVPIKFQSIEHISDNFFSVFDGSKYGLFIGNQLVTGFEFSKIELFHKDFVSLTNDMRIFYYDLKENKILKPQIEIE